PIGVGIQQKMIVDGDVFQRAARIGIVGSQHVKAAEGVLDQVVFKRYLLYRAPIASAVLISRRKQYRPTKLIGLDPVVLENVSFDSNVLSIFQLEQILDSP